MKVDSPAPLAKSADGSGTCGKPVFAGTGDPDYQAILKTFAPALAQLEQTPRTDMPGAKASVAVNLKTAVEPQMDTDEHR